MEKDDEEYSLTQRDMNQYGIIPATTYPSSAPLIYQTIPPTENHALQNQNQNQHQNGNQNSTNNYFSKNSNDSEELSLLYESIFHREINEKYIAEAQQVAVNIIRNLFLKRMKDIEHSIRNVPYIPDIPQLRSVSVIHSNELNELTLDQTLRLLCQLLQHDSSFVRYIILKKIHHLFVLKRQQISSMISGEEVGVSDRVYVLPAESSISLLLQEMLRLSSKESEPRIVELCAKCLGIVSRNFLIGLGLTRLDLTC